MHTTAGNLLPRIKYVIHTPGPDAREVKDADKCAQLVKDTYFNCLSYANMVLEAKSIALPAVSSGMWLCGKLNCNEVSCHN